MKAYAGFVYRQATGNPERNLLQDGAVMNPVLNVQDLPTSRFPTLKTASLDIFTCDAVIAVLRAIIGEPKLVQSMYFEGNPATWAHQDTYYLDSENVGSMVAAWFALEDIHPGAGRFYVYPGSHKADVCRNRGDFNIAMNHDRYKRVVADFIETHDLECRAPALQEGDILFWHSKTIHGSLISNVAGRTRSSLTAHYIPVGDRFLQFQSRILPLRLASYNGVPVHKPKDQDLLRNRAVLAIEAAFPRVFRFVKKAAMKWVTG
jgi:phytanoyl-CoA hydroxylase